MTQDEHRNIIALIDRAVRAGDEAAHPPMDIEADAIIRALFVRNPRAAYYITQMAIAQQEELARLRSELAEAKARIERNWFARLLNTSTRKHTQDHDPELGHAQAERA